MHFISKSIKSFTRNMLQYSEVQIKRLFPVKRKNFSHLDSYFEGEKNLHVEKKMMRSSSLNQSEQESIMSYLPIAITILFKPLKNMIRKLRSITHLQCHMHMLMGVLLEMCMCNVWSHLKKFLSCSSFLQATCTMTPKWYSNICT